MAGAKWALSQKIEARRFARDYMDRLETHLRTLDTEQQANLLSELLCLWLRIHAALNGNSRVNLDNYLEIIIELNERLQKAADDIVETEIKLHLDELETLGERSGNEPSPAR
jgi:hypothetical protein